MKKKDIEAGGVYAYREGTKYGSFEPILILDTEPYYLSRLVPAARKLERVPGTRLTGGSYHRGPVGLLAVKPYVPLGQGRADRLRDLATVEDAVAHNGYGEVKDEAGTVVGRYKLVTSYSYLHGPYDEIVTREHEQEERRKRYEAEREAHRDAVRKEALALKARLEAVGLDMSHWYVSAYSVPSKVELTFEQAGDLLTIIEGSGFTAASK